MKTPGPPFVLEPAVKQPRQRRPRCEHPLLPRSGVRDATLARCPECSRVLRFKVWPFNGVAMAGWVPASWLQRRRYRRAERGQSAEGDVA
jgi:hypothetical protein